MFGTSLSVQIAAGDAGDLGEWLREVADYCDPQHETRFALKSVQRVMRHASKDANQEQALLSIRLTVRQAIAVHRVCYSLENALADIFEDALRELGARFDPTEGEWILPEELG